MLPGTPQSTGRLPVQKSLHSAEEALARLLPSHCRQVQLRATAPERILHGHTTCRSPPPNLSPSRELCARPLPPPLQPRPPFVSSPSLQQQQTLFASQRTSRSLVPLGLCPCLNGPCPGAHPVRPSHCPPPRLVCVLMPASHISAVTSRSQMRFHFSWRPSALHCARGVGRLGRTSHTALRKAPRLALRSSGSKLFCSLDLRQLVGPRPLDPSTSQLEANKRLTGPGCGRPLSAPIYSQTERQKPGPQHMLDQKQRTKRTVKERCWKQWLL